MFPFIFALFGIESSVNKASETVEVIQKEQFKKASFFLIPAIIIGIIIFQK